MLKQRVAYFSFDTKASPVQQPLLPLIHDIKNYICEIKHDSMSGEIKEVDL
ncbi:MAG: hypothetical protein ACFWTJ_12085 [Lachnoclostridium sp.]|jgi:hypothetical protein